MKSKRPSLVIPGTAICCKRGDQEYAGAALFTDVEEKPETRNATLGLTF